MVVLVPMNQEDYHHYLQQTVGEYAKEKVRAGAWKESEALKLSEETFARLLPKGLETLEMFLYRIEDVERREKIGYYWLYEMESPVGKALFIYDFLIFEPYQGQGFGKQAMAALDEKARELGATQISLHVFGHNIRAFRLYEKSGYVITDYQMSKRLD